MTYRLYPNIKKMTTIFCMSIICITLLTLIMRLTFLRDMAVVPAGAVINATSQISQGGDDANALAYQINSKIYFETATSKGNVLITNPEANNSHMRVDLVRDDTGKSIYYSGYISPGTPVKSVKLQDDTLEDGIYPCTAIITAYDIDSKEKLGSEELPVMVYIGVKPD